MALPDAAATLTPSLSDLGQETVAALGSLALLAIVFVPLERVLPARPQRILRRELPVDLAFFAGQYLLFGGWIVAALWVVQRWADGWQLLDGLHASVAVFPPVGVALLGVVAGDGLVYWLHRACHRFEWLWRFHAVHHTSQELDWLAAHREHPVDGLLTQLAQNLPAILLGVDFRLLAALAVLRSSWGIFIHSNVRLPLGPLALLLGSPELHHWHHAAVPRTRHNFANLAPWLDVIFGTYYRPSAELPSASYPLGLPTPAPSGYLAQLVWPFLPDSTPPVAQKQPERAPKRLLSIFRKVRSGRASA